MPRLLRSRPKAMTAGTETAARQMAHRLGSQAALLLFAALAYIPALTSAPGRMPADTKLFLYLNPDRLFSDAIWMWDPRQFGGWVPHQTVGYLWPMGPWFWLFERIGAPDWIAHRLWIGTILFAASTGMRWCAKQLGLARWPACVAGLTYGLSPFLLAYVGRTSGLLLPWAGLGWMLGIVVRATQRDRGTWRDPADMALVLACMGGLNATATILIAPPLVLWLLDSVLRRAISLRRGLTLVAQIALLAVGTSLWWLGGLLIQGRYGANLLAYSETLDAVTFTATGSEVLRGVGYWLFYIVERDGPLTVAATRYQTSAITIAISFAVVIGAIVGLIATRWRGRRFAGWCLLCGVVLSTGVHPIAQSSPLMSLPASHPTSAWALAFRSSTRAVPVILVALSLGLGAASSWLAARLGGRRPAWNVVVQLAVAALIVANLPALWRGQLVNPVQSRQQDVPDAWRAAADELDAGLDGGGRVLQLPGTEFGVHRWGNLVDPLLPGITDRPVITRDLLPLGNPGVMDLLYALDDRVHEGTLDPAALAPVARLLGADEILLAGDVAYERYRTRHPVRVKQVIEPAPGIGPLRSFGPESTNAASGVVDAADLAQPSSEVDIAPVALAAVTSPVPIVRAKEREVLVVGSGMGLVDAAAAGLIDGTELIRYSGSLDPPMAAGRSTVIVTDSNRKQAHQWRGSRDVLGMTEDVEAAVLDVDLADHRLPVFDSLPADRFTTAQQRGPVTATASSYGEPISYRPEDRAFRAIDGDTSTAWRVADRAEPIGERIRLTTTDGQAVSTLVVVQDLTPGANRWITEIDVRTDVGSQRVVLSAASRTADGQMVALVSPAATWVEIEIAATNTGRRPVYPGFGPVGFAEISLDRRGPTTEIVVLPSDTAALTATPDTSIVLTRWRAEATDPARSDPESTISREWTQGASGTFALAATVRLGARLTDAQLATTLGFAGESAPGPVPEASSSLPGEPRAGAWAAFDGDFGTGWVPAIGDQQPTIGLSFPTPRSIETLQFGFDLGPQRSLPSSATITLSDVSFDAPLAIDAAGNATVSFEPTRTSFVNVLIGIGEPTQMADLRTGERVDLPIGIRELSFPGLDPLVPQPAAVGCRSDLLEINGQPIPVELQASTIPLLTQILDRLPIALTTCDGSPVALSDGVQTLRTAAIDGGGLQIDQISLRSPAAQTRAIGGTMPTTTVTANSRTGRTVEVASCPVGCWLVLGEGWSSGWLAETADGVELGSSTFVDGGFNGWWIEPTTQMTTVELRWAPQDGMRIPLAISAFSVIACIVLRRPRRKDKRDRAPMPVAAPPSILGPVARLSGSRLRPSATQLVAGVAGTALIVQPIWAIGAAFVGFVAWWFKRPAIWNWTGLSVIAAVTGFYLWRQTQLHPFPGYGWIVNIAEMHRPTMFAVVLLAVGLSVRDDPSVESPATDPEHPSESPATSTPE